MLTMLSISVPSCVPPPRSIYFNVVAFVLIFQAKTADAFSTNSPIAVNPLSSASHLIAAQNDAGQQQSLQYSVALSALNHGRNDHQNQDQSYDFIPRSQANKMLQQERLKNEREIRQMKIALKRQHQELLQYDGEALNIQLANEDDESDAIDPEICDEIESDERIDDFPFSAPFPDDINEEEFRQHHERSHTTAEYRTIEIALQQIHEDNEDLKSEFNERQKRYESEIEETIRMIADTRDRFDCLQHELKLEALYFERAKAEIEEILDRERAQALESEQQIEIARREQEILEQAAVEAQHQQDLQEQEERELRRQQEQIQIEREELERKQQQLQQEQEEHERQLQHEIMQQQAQQEQAEQLRHEELLRNHQELVDLEQHQKDFDDIYFNIYNGNSNKEDFNNNAVQNQSQNRGNAGYSTPSPQSTHFSEYDVTQQHQQRQAQPQPQQRDQEEQRHQKEYQQYQQWQWEQTYNTSSQQSQKGPKRETRKNSRSHGIFMNFNDMLI